MISCLSHEHYASPEPASLSRAREPFNNRPSINLSFLKIMTVCMSVSVVYFLSRCLGNHYCSLVKCESVNFKCSLTCTLRASSEFCEVSSSICLRSSATVLRSAGAGEWWAESGSPWQVASSWAGVPLERLESSFSRGKVQKQWNKMIVIFLMWLRLTGMSVWNRRAHSLMYQHAPCQGLESVCSHRPHTWEVKHFIQVIRVTGLHLMTSPQLLKQLVPLCLCLLETLLQLG